MKPNIIITMGDPSGIGPEVTVKSLASSSIRRLANFLVIGDGFVMKRLELDTGLKLKAPLLDLSNVSPKYFSYGKSHPLFGGSSIKYIDKALELIRSGKADGLVTAPVNKASVKSAGLKNFEGHTEYLAHNSGTENFAMMFVGKKLKVTLVTRHIALERVTERLSVESIGNAIALTYRTLKKIFDIPNPRIGVCGLNPHAGESGMFGDEEERIILPAVKIARKNYGDVVGPLPSDALFHDALTGRFDAVIAMYHDQGLIPFKLLYFRDGVNMTLGLPFIRTSPDHGTAFDIAGKGIADPSSMKEAIILACRLSRKKISSK